MSEALTIAVPFYKGTEYLRRTLGSIFAQSGSRWTVLLVDNSVDADEQKAALAIVASLPPSRLRYVRNQTHVSGSENFNRCIDLAETDLVSTVHGDDEVLPSYADELLSLAERHPDAAILSLPVRTINKDSQPCFSFVDSVKRFLMPRGTSDFVLQGEPALRSILRGNWINGAALCYRRSLLGNLRWDKNYPMASDLDLYARTILSGKTIAGTLRSPSYLYRRHAGQTTVQLSTNLYRFREESLLLGRLASRAAAQGWMSAAAVGEAKVTLQLHVLLLAMRDITHGSIERAREKLRLLQEIRRSGRLSPEA